MRIIAALLTLCLTGFFTSASALTKAEALTCVNLGVKVFFKGAPISNMVDVPFMIEREGINGSEKEIQKLLDQRARENIGYYRNVKAIVAGQPQAKSNDFFLVAGNVRGEETKKLDPVTWVPFKYNYILWIRKDDDRCLIGVLAIEEFFRLASWVKQNL